MPIRVLLDASTSLARSALKATLGECADIELVDPSDSPSAQAKVDVVVIQKRLLDDVPALRDAERIGIVAIDDDGQAGELYKIRHNKWEFSARPSGGLIDAIRAVASVH